MALDGILLEAAKEFRLENFRAMIKKLPEGQRMFDDEISLVISNNSYNDQYIALSKSEALEVAHILLEYFQSRYQSTCAWGGIE